MTCGQTLVWNFKFGQACMRKRYSFYNSRKLLSIIQILQQFHSKFSKASETFAEFIYVPTIPQYVKRTLCLQNWPTGLSLASSNFPILWQDRTSFFPWDEHLNNKTVLCRWLCAYFCSGVSLIGFLGSAQRASGQKGISNRCLRRPIDWRQFIKS